MDDKLHFISENFQAVLRDVLSAYHRKPRTGSPPRIVVVTKNQPETVVKAAVAAGARLLGENYADEAVSKIENLGDFPDIEWHMIGHIQSRKAVMVCRHFDWVHSLDSVHIAEKLSRLCVEQGKILPVLLELNVGGEDTKYGWVVRDELDYRLLVADIEKIVTLPNLVIRGLMTMPPWSADPEHSRPYFQKLRELRDRLTKQFSSVEWIELSMGTSVDYQVAVEEGATYLRIGTAILGPRN